MYVIAKGKDHKQYEYGNKVSIVSTKDTNIIVGVAVMIKIFMTQKL
ncbi:ISPg7, transposase [uncultured Gammaproteobacteria bacterium]|nr:ISPg7, transposase [uncultured Gammaproteobacteria bacterium]